MAQVTVSIFGKRSRSGLSRSVHEASQRRSHGISFDSANLPESIGGFLDSLAQVDRELLTKNYDVPSDLINNVTQDQQFKSEVSDLARSV